MLRKHYCEMIMIAAAVIIQCNLKCSKFQVRDIWCYREIVFNARLVVAKLRNNL
jgi:hypothetical protein